MKPKIILIGLVMAVIISRIAVAGDWTRWRGPHGDSYSGETGWNPRALEEALKIKWETDLGKGHSTVAVQDNRIYALGNKPLTDEEGGTAFFDVVSCLNAATGEELWRYAYPCPDKEWPGPNASPVVDGTRLYTLSWEGDLYCFDTERGSVNWKRNLVSDSLSVRSEWGFCGSPVVFENMLLLTAGRSGAALDKTTGRILWKSENEVCGFSTPVLYENGRKQMGIFSALDDLHGVDTRTGEVLWTQPWKSCNDPYVFDDKVFLTANHKGKKSALFQIKDSGLERVWDSRILMGWSFQNQVQIDGFSYGIGNMRRTREVQCVDLETGELKWHYDHGHDGAIMAAGDKLIILEADGELVVAETNPEAYTEISRARVLEEPAGNSAIRYQRRWSCWTLPVIVNGHIYTRSNMGDLVCIDMRE